MAMFMDRHAVASKKQPNAPSRDVRLGTWQMCRLFCDMSLLYARFPGQMGSWRVVVPSKQTSRRAALQASAVSLVAMWQMCTMRFTRAHLVEMIPGGVDAWMWMVLIRILVSIRNSLLASSPASHMCQMQKCTLSLFCSVR